MACTMEPKGDLIQSTKPTKNKNKEQKLEKSPEIPTLTDLAILRVVISLWDQDDIRKLVAEIEFESREFPEKEAQWKKLIESEVKSKVKMLQVPEKIEQSLFCAIENVSCQVLLWKHCPNTIYYINGLKDYCWTIHGSILVRYW